MNRFYTDLRPPAEPRDRRARIARLASLLLALTAAVALAAPVPGPPSAAGPPAGELRRATLRHDGLDRGYALYLPPRLAETPALVLVLHGSGGDAERIRALTGRSFERLADELGFAVAYPEGFESNWNGCRARAPFSARRLDVDDPGFLRALVARLRGEGGRGPGAGGVLAFGFSGGGHLALRVALESPELADAVAVVGASLPDPADSDCSVAGRPLPVLVIAGTDDPINPFSGGDVVLPEPLGGAALGRVLPAEATAAHFAGLAGHGEPVLSRDPDRDGDPTLGIERRVWSGAGPEVALITVDGGGHTIPRSPAAGAPFPVFLGRMSTEIDAADEAWRFFERNREAAGAGSAAAR